MRKHLKFYAATLLMVICADQILAQTAATGAKSSTGAKTTTGAKSHTGAKSSTGTKSGKTKTAPKAAPTVEGKAITVTLKSLAEADISIFDGKKEDLKTAQLKNFGGLSKNTLYVRENDVVCIMKGRTPISCADVKPGTTYLEVNSSGNVIVVKKP